MLMSSGNTPTFWECVLPRKLADRVQFYAFPRGYQVPPALWRTLNMRKPLNMKSAVCNKWFPAWTLSFLSHGAVMQMAVEK